MYVYAKPNSLMGFTFFKGKTFTFVYALQRCTTCKLRCLNFSPNFSCRKLSGLGYIVWLWGHIFTTTTHSGALAIYCLWWWRNEEHSIFFYVCTFFTRKNAWWWWYGGTKSRFIYGPNSCTLGALLQGGTHILLLCKAFQCMQGIDSAAMILWLFTASQGREVVCPFVMSYCMGHDDAYFER